MQFRLVTSEHGADLLGLAPFRLEPLRRVVALFGPNGAGKSRLLRLARDRMQFLSHAYQNLDRELMQAKANLVASRDRKEAPEQIARMQGIVNDLSALSENPGTFFNVLPTKRSLLIDLTNKGVHLHAAQSRPTIERDRCLDDDKAFEGGHWKTTKGLASELTALFESTVICAERLDRNLPCNERGAVFGKLFPAAKTLVQELMSMELGYLPVGSSPVPSLNGRVWKPEEFSTGQKNLLYYIGCILMALARQHHGLVSPIRFGGAVIVIDEPEAALHPQATKELHRSLLKLVGEDGQLWIATHSLALVSEVEPESMWLVRNGQVSGRSRNAATKAVELLVGTREEVQKLADVVEEGNRAKFRKFLSECILRPTVVPLAADDPQVAQILRALRSAMVSSETVIVLDVGAGVGRLAEELSDLSASEGPNAVEYIPVEPNATYHSAIRKASVSGLRVREPVRSIPELERVVMGRVHVAVLCNVLHEVEPTEWVELLNGIMDSLRQDGVLLICEDLEMPVGELCSRSGFLVLSDAELGLLFSATNAPVLMDHSDPGLRGRLQCVAISARAGRVTEESVRIAIKCAQRRLHARVSRLRSGDEMPKDGRDYARACMMLLNCSFALEGLPGGSSG